MISLRDGWLVNSYWIKLKKSRVLSNSTPRSRQEPSGVVRSHPESESSGIGVAVFQNSTRSHPESESESSGVGVIPSKNQIHLKSELSSVDSGWFRLRSTPILSYWLQMTPTPGRIDGSRFWRSRNWTPNRHSNNQTQTRLVRTLQRAPHHYSQFATLPIVSFFGQYV